MTPRQTAGERDPYIDVVAQIGVKPHLSGSVTDLGWYRRPVAEAEAWEELKLGLQSAMFELNRAMENAAAEFG